MEIRPILSALMRSKVAMILIGLQVALTLAIVCNALFIISQRLEHMARPSGMNESRHVLVRQQRLRPGLQREGRAAVRSRDAAPAAGRRRRGADELGADERRRLEHGPQPRSRARRRRPRDTTIYLVDDHAIEHVRHASRRRPQLQARGNRVARFRRSAAARRSRSSRKALADKLFPDEDAIGKQVYFDQDPPTTTIIGVVDRLQEPWMSSDDDRERDVRAGVHAVRQLDALSRARRARPPRRSHEARSSRR